VRRQPVRGSAHGRVEGQPGGGTSGGACGGPGARDGAAGAPTMAAVEQGPAEPTTVPAEALAPATTKGGPAIGWGRAPATVPAGAPAAATAPTTCSQEVEGAA
jgi:hypothetical protein